MKLLGLIILVGLLLTTVASAHTLEKNNIVRSDGTYNVQFSIDPAFPVTDELIHVDFSLWDNNGIVLTGLDVSADIQSERGKVTAVAEEKELGHYGIDYIASLRGVQTITPRIEGIPIEVTFDVYIDAFWPNGWISVSILVFFLVLLTQLMYKEYRGKHDG